MNILHKRYNTKKGENTQEMQFLVYKFIYAMIEMQTHNLIYGSLIILSSSKKLQPSQLESLHQLWCDSCVKLYADCFEL